MKAPFPVAVLLALVTAAEAPAADLAGQHPLERTLDELIAQSRLNVGLAIKDLLSGHEILRQPDRVFPQGSSIRIHLVAELYRQAAAGKFSVDEVRPLPPSARVGGYGVVRYLDAGLALTLRDYAVLAITVNDNSAANFLTDLVGMESVNASLAAQGTPEIKFRRKAVSRRTATRDLPENTATPRAAMRALDLLFQGAVVDRATSEAIIEVLSLQEISYFRRFLPPGIRFAGRSGSGPTFRCDQGIVLLPKHPYIFCVMIDEIAGGGPETPQDYTRADNLIGQLSRAAYRHFSGSRSSGTQPAERR
jgi:beta-lactamase class A